MLNSIYIAGKFTARDRLRPIKNQMKEHGYNVSSYWIDADFGLIPFEQRAAMEAGRDLMEVSAASSFILDTLDESNTGGREVELGIALARDIQITLIGPRRNVFHHLISERDHFASWEDFFRRGL